MYVTAETPREHCRLEPLEDGRWRAFRTKDGVVIDAPEQVWADKRAATKELHAAGWTLIVLTRNQPDGEIVHVYVRYLTEEQES